MSNHIGNSEHVLIAGRTGSGKTYAAKKYLTNYKNVVVLDTKGRVSWPEIPGSVWDPENPYILLDGGPNLTLVTHFASLQFCRTPKIIYRPCWEEMNQDYYNRFFKWIYRRENTIVWVDEVMSVSPNPSTLPEFYRACLTRGRELNIGVWSLTQRPSGINQLVISESSHIFAFDLNLPQDREKIVDVTGAREFYEKPGKYLFWYYFVEWDRAIKAKLVES